MNNETRDGKGEGATPEAGVYAIDKHGGTPGNPSAKPSPTTTTTPRTLPPFTLICTVHFSAAGTKWLSPPEDRTCDFIYYESLLQPMCIHYEYQDKPRVYFRQKDIIVKLASTIYKHTRIGISVDFMGLEEFQKKFHTPQGKQEVEEFNAVRIRDWGFLNLHKVHWQTKFSRIKEAFITLKDLAEHQASVKVESYMLLGLYLENETVCEQAAGFLDNIFTPHGIISLGHNSIGCGFVYGSQYMHTMAVNSDVDQSQMRDGLTEGQYLGQAVRAVRCLQNKGVNTMFAVSLSVAPIHSIACEFKEEGDELYFQRCARQYIRQEMGEVCEVMSSVTYNEDYKSVSSYTVGNNYLFFDTLQTLRVKACGTWENTKDLRLGVSIYDINFDYIWQNAPNSNESHKTCSNETMWDGDWVRTKYLLKFRHFLANDYPKMNNEEVFEERCLNI